MRSRIVASGPDRPGDAELGSRLQTALLSRAAQELGPRWRGPFQDEGDARPQGPDFYDGIATGPDRLVILVATEGDAAAQEVRAALYRCAAPDATAFPPVSMAPDAESVRSGALRLALQRLSERPVPVYVVDLLGVAGSAMPEALRAVTWAIAREARAEDGARWIVLIDPLYQNRIARWSDPGFFGSVRLARSVPTDGVSLAIETERDPLSLRVGLIGSLGALYVGVIGDRARRAGTDRIAADVACVQRLVDRALQGLRGCELVETERSLRMHPLVEPLTRLAVEYRSGAIDRDAFVDRTLAILAELRREVPEEATRVAELVAAHADSLPLEVVPLPDDARFVETIGPPPAVQGVRSPRRLEREPEPGA